jgi:hypothetical protein
MLGLIVGIMEDYRGLWRVIAPIFIGDGGLSGFWGSPSIPQFLSALQKVPSFV